ncbi:hypothetical protein EUTSA_v10008814mg [Eutrema salsugineum]|uniref:Uncharacterized protein n=1 Tax=Eutrema salsugineum TaxID=72664 RepID=V4MQ32_EUTSA|nr:putative protein TPRXL [Eutrema salsugineum]ESQ33781.1 hypothetical protein EUTSA_v10008814mg [Eutrema salsugineum]
MDMKLAEIQKRMLTIILLCLLVSFSSEAAPQTQLATPLEPTGEVINSPTKPQGLPIESQNQPILGQPSTSSSSFVNQPITGFNQPLTGLNQPSSTGLSQPILDQPSSSSSSVNQPLTGLNQPLTGFSQPSSTGFNQPISSASSSNSGLNQPFGNRLNQNGLSGNGVPFLNGNSKLEVSITKIVFIWIALLLALHGTERN